MFKQWRAHMEKETGKTLKILHTDGGGKYTSNTFSTYLADNGIKCELTNVYTPQENGVSKHANCTLNNLAQSMIADAKEVLQNKSLPPSLWSHAIHLWLGSRIRCSLIHSTQISHCIRLILGGNHPLPLSDSLAVKPMHTPQR